MILRNADRISTNSTQSGNIFFAIFGAIALVGLLGAATMTFMKGPLSSAVKLTKINSAETQMTIGAQVAVMSTTSQANSGDCDSDGFVEPQPWRAATTEPIPTNGGLIPLSLGISKKDPWGTEYGYCVWNHGAMTSGGTCGANMLTGTNSTAYPVVAIVSAGPDKAFTTTCRTFASADANSDGDLDDAADHPLVSKAAETDDDIIQTFTYEEATAASGGLWSLKSGDPATAVIDKKIETTGTASLAGGVLLPNSALITCDATTAGVMAKNASGTGIEICDGTGSWTSISGGSGASSSFATSTATCDSTTAGQVRYNGTSGLPEFCNGTVWTPFALSVAGVNLIISPSNSSAMDVNGASNQDTVTCTPASGYVCGSEYTFTVTNTGTTTSSSMVVSLTNGITTLSSAASAVVTNASNFVITSNTCSGATLATNASCAIKIRPKANGNIYYTWTLQITANNNPIAVMQGTASNFGCVPGRTGGGGVYAYCGLSSSEGGYNLVVTPGGCTNTTYNPTCSGGSDTKTAIYGASGVDFYNNGWIPYNDTIGARASVYAMAYSAATGVSMPAIQWCSDLVYGGYDDWYLPAVLEFHNYIYPTKTLTGGFVSTQYITSTFTSSNNNMYLYDFSSGSWTDYYRTQSGYRVRCARRDNVALPTATDADPDGVSIAPAVSFTSGASMTSSTLTIQGIYSPITASISASSGSPEIIKNGVATGSTTASGLTWGNTLAFKMNAPTTLGTKNTATITIGPDTYTWWVGYADSSRVAKVFITNSTYQYMGGNIGGLAGANAKCTAAAASSSLGLSGNWKALISTDSINASDNIPWNWGSLKNTANQTVVDGGFSDLWDGSLDTAIQYDQNGTASTAYAWTGTASTGGADPASFSTSNGGVYHACSNWTANYTTGSNYTYSRMGLASDASSSWITYPGIANCTDTRALYCVEDIDDTSDTTPAAMVIPYQVQVALSARISSSSITVGGMSASASQTMTVTATGGNPAFTINGGSEVTSGTIHNGDVIVFKMDSPSTASTSYKMTVTAGSMTAYWRVWTGPAASGVTKRVFVTSTDPSGSSFGGAAGSDSVCQTRAAAASLGGTWKAILSGIAESEWAVNRVGYNWDTLKLVDGTTTVVNTAGGLWSTLLHAIDKTEFGATRSSARVLSGTASDGRSYSSVSDLSNLYNWTGASCSATYMQGNSSALSAAITQGYWLCQSDGALYCIEQ